MILSNDGLVAIHYRSYGIFFLQQNRLHNIYRGFTHYKYYRAFLLSKVSEPSVFEQGDLFCTLIEGSEEAKRDGL